MEYNNSKTPPISTKKSDRTPPVKKDGQCKGRRALTGNGEMLDLQSAADLIGLSSGTTYARAMRGQIPHRRFSGRIIFLRSELHKWMESLPGIPLEKVLEIERARKGGP
jgi:predicted DNA-binding transcriptional regulator AlpA